MLIFPLNFHHLVPKSLKILLFSTASFTFTLYLINRQRRSPFVIHLASNRALAGRALLLGTAASCSGNGILVGSIATTMGVESFKEFRIKADEFFIRHDLKRSPPNEPEENGRIGVF